MRRHGTTFGEIRETAGLLLLEVFLLTAQLGPVVHLVTHTADHTHNGPLARASRPLDHDAAHLAGRPHEHGYQKLAPQERTRSIANRTRASLRNADAASLPWELPQEPNDEHGRNSVAHLSIAFLGGPPPPIVLPPAGTIATLPVLPPCSIEAPSRREPPARGPPDVTRL